MASLRFYAGDGRGRIKTLTCSLQNPKEPTITENVVHASGTGSDRAVQRLALTRDEEPSLVCARAGGSVSLYSVKEDASLTHERTWTPAKNPSADSGFIALDSIVDRGILTCTTSGALALTAKDGAVSSVSLTSKLKDLRLSPDAKSFASGGDEVELSVWDLERAFSSSDAPQPALKKRKQNEPAHPAETWQAKNVPYDNLNLRVPVQISSLTFLGNSHEVVTGTSFGAVRRYDTRTARKPVANWTEIVKKGAIRRVERGVSEHDIFVSDERGQLFALDIRNGKPLYSYKGIGGTVTSFAMNSTQHILSASMDRYVRLHSTAAPPATAGQNLDARGEIMVKFYTQDVVTAVTRAGEGDPGSKDDEEVGEDIWEQLPDVDDEEEQRPPRRKRRKG